MTKKTAKTVGSKPSPASELSGDELECVRDAGDGNDQIAPNEIGFSPLRPGASRARDGHDLLIGGSGIDF